MDGAPPSSKPPNPMLATPPPGIIVVEIRGAMKRR
jgi:hypothetical protein